MLTSVIANLFGLASGGPGPAVTPPAFFKEKVMKKQIVIAWIVLSALVLAWGGGCEKKSGEGDTSGMAGRGGADDPVWIKVNGQDIYRSEVESEMDQIRSQMESQTSHSQVASLEPMVKWSAMRRMVEKTVLEQTAEKEQVTIEPATVEEELEKIKSQFPSPEVFEQQLMQAQLTEEKLKEQIELGIRIRNLLEKKISVPDPSEEQIVEIYERAKPQLMNPEQAVTNHIMIMLPPGATDEDRNKKKELALSVAKKAKGGESFEALVEQYSDSPNKEDAGKQTFPRGQMPGSFDEAVFALEPGQISSPIETPMGYYIVKLDSIVPESATPLEDVREDIVGFIKQEKEKEAMMAYVEKAVEDSNVEYVEPLPDVPGMGGQEGAGMEEGGTEMEEGMAVKEEGMTAEEGGMTAEPEPEDPAPGSTE